MSCTTMLGAGQEEKVGSCVAGPVTPNQKEGVKSLATAPAALGVRECRCVVCWYVAGCW